MKMKIKTKKPIIGKSAKVPNKKTVKAIKKSNKRSTGAQLISSQQADVAQKVDKRKGKAFPVFTKNKRAKLDIEYKKNIHFMLPNAATTLSKKKKAAMENLKVKKQLPNRYEMENSSDSEYSMDDDCDFFRKPKIFVCNSTENNSLELVGDTKMKAGKVYDFNMEAIEANVVKILVFEGIEPESELVLENNSIDNAEAESENVSMDNGESEPDSPNDSIDNAEYEPDSSNTSIENDAVELMEEVEVNRDAVIENKNSIENDVDMKTDTQDLELLELCVFENSLKTNNVLAVLKQDIEFYGTVIVTLLCGRININGYKATTMEPLTIYSPKGFNWVHISPLVNKRPPKDNFNWDELNETFSRAQLENIMGNYDKQRDAIVLLQRNSGAQQLLNSFAKHMAENVFPVLHATNRPHYASEYLLNCLIQSADKRTALQVPTVWTKLALQPSSRMMITGGKGVGKSTMLRYLVNRHLGKFPRMLLIDLDLGQPELFVPQTISCSVIDAPLLGHGLFHNKQPDHAYVVGHVNVVMCAEQYLRAVRQLLAHCRANSSYADIPWLINTMGYNKGFGLELMALLVDCVQPTDVVQIAGRKPINNFDESLDGKTLSKLVPIIYTSEEFKLGNNWPKYALHQLRSAVPQLDYNNRAWMMSAKDVRYSNLLARLSATLRGNAKHLTDCPPLQVDLAALQIVHLTSVEYTREELIAGMEANLVYLCQRFVANQPVECLGIGVVRAIDQEAQKLYLLPAMPLQRLTNVNCLVLGGDLCLPQGFFKDQGAGVANNVPFVFIINDSKSSKSIQQIYFRAPGFLGAPSNKKN